MSKQTSTAAGQGIAAVPPQGENPLLNILRLTAICDPHHMVEAMQKLFPFHTLPGVDAARLTEMQEQNMAVFQAATQHVQEVLSSTAKAECRMLEECIGDALRAIQEAPGDPLEASAKQTEMVVLTIERLSKETIEVLTKNSEQIVSALKDLALRYVNAMKELKQVS